MNTNMISWAFSWDSWSSEHFWYYTKRMFAWFLWVLAIMSVSDAFMVNDAAAETGVLTITTIGNSLVIAGLL